jgi:hypothetical protein
MIGFQPGPDRYPLPFTPGVSKLPKLLNRDGVPPARQREGLLACQR